MSEEEPKLVIEGDFAWFDPQPVTNMPAIVLPDCGDRMGVTFGETRRHPE